MISPNNTARQRMVGDVAARNHDFQTAERAYGKVLERRRGSSLNNIDDYSNLARAMLDLRAPRRRQTNCRRTPP
jgi:hypothetical protein